ncbi:hydrolase Nlp/P60 [Sinomicrobium pectinilyticum]|uniref:Hydrolase Nlp/P60 n=1 Tax=Sinomicrobium pectinilyticum TaxID=1084421 RepID=A0A3N0DR42_SINP1|nr:NlpC/P60 family protein [Sinomicrobium pectinilyticum]RNL78092.1 hydrolase Nlp/P60 [Sinomicrobium pectinilyticum]
MQYGICNLSIVPLRSNPSDTAELTSQALYGEHFKVLEQQKYWSRIRLAFDRHEGWIDNKQYLVIEEDTYKNMDKDVTGLSSDMVEFITDHNGQLMPVPIGSHVSSSSFLSHHFDGRVQSGIQQKGNLVETAFSFLNAPHQRGGKTPFGIDAAGLAQMVYKLNGYPLLRQAAQQATQGEALSFIEESEPGDLAFFDDDEGNIVHVGIIMRDNYVIHSYGKVRIDRIDHTGIFNVDTRRHTHKLRVIKKII